MNPSKVMIHAAVLAVGMAITASSADAGELAVGATLKAFSLPDQRDQSRQVNQDTRLLLFCRDKDIAKMVFSVLGEKEDAYLANRHAEFVLDISAMPRLITWAIAKPRMRRHSFPFMLDSEPSASKDLPAKEGQLTLIFLNKLSVENVKFISRSDELKAELESLKP